MSEDGSKVTQENYDSVFGWGGIYLGANGYNSIFGGYPFVNAYSANNAGLDGIVFTAASDTAASDTAAVPEPSQVAASLLLVAGIAGLVIVRRRKEASELEALAA